MEANDLGREQVLAPEWYRETGKVQIRSGDPKERSEGLGNLLKAFRMQDAEATYLVGELMLRGVLRPAVGDPEEHGLNLLCIAAKRGCPQARSLLNRYCETRYEVHMSGKDTSCNRSGPLVDFDGVPIKIDRKGVLTPIDAILTCVDGRNCLTLRANICFIYSDEREVPDPDGFEEAVMDGIRAWEGEYKVFGDQPLRVVMELTTEDRAFDNVFVFPFTDSMGAAIQKVSNAVGTKKTKERTNSMISGKRSFATGGLRWSVRSRKMIFIQSVNGKFDDYEEIKHVAKHEFGHALGLGDLYESPVDRLSGVDKGTFYELDGYYMADKSYNLVMCDHHGPISNNDIEMVLLAFRENKMQLYQPTNLKGKISKALGRGN